MKILVFVPVTFFALQILMFRWSFERGNRRIALRIMHAMTIASSLLCIAAFLLN